MSGIGVVAALAAEARALGPSMPRGGAIPLAEVAALGDGSLLAVSGIGYAAAAAAAQTLRQAGATALMTFGMAGGLDPALKCGSVVLPVELIGAGNVRFAACRTWRERVAAAISPLRGVTEGALLTSLYAIDAPADKAEALRATGAVAVDMESAAVAQVAAEHNLPFIAVRVIVDTAVDRLPHAVVDASRAGRVQIGKLLAGLIMAPGEIGGLIRLAQRYRIAMRTLRLVSAHLT